MSLKVDQIIQRASTLVDSLRPAGAVALSHAVKLAGDAGAFGHKVHQAWQQHRPGAGAVHETSDAPTVQDILDDWWKRHALVELKDSTRDSYQAPLARIRTAFGHLDAGHVNPLQLARYQEWRAQTSVAAAKKEGSLLTSALTFAAERGMIDFNPLKGHSSRADFVREQETRREPSPEEVEAFCQLNPHLAGYIRLKQATGLGQTRLLSIDLDKHWDGTTLSLPACRGEQAVALDGEAVCRAIESILDGRPAEGHLFLNTRGTRVKSASFRSSFRRAMTKYVSAGGSRFCEQEIPQFTGTISGPVALSPTQVEVPQTIQVAAPAAVDPDAANATTHTERPMKHEVDSDDDAQSAEVSISARVRALNFADSMLMPPSQHDLRSHLHAPGG